MTVQEPATEFTGEVLKACEARGLLIIGAGIYGNVIRFLAPLVITDEQLNRGLDILAEEFAKAVETPLVAAISWPTRSPSVFLEGVGAGRLVGDRESRRGIECRKDKKMCLHVERHSESATDLGWQPPWMNK